MSDLIAIAYDDLTAARTAVDRLGETLAGGELALDDCVIVERREGGEVKLHQPSLTTLGAVTGALWGGLIGILFLVPLLGAAVGAAAGAVRGATRDTGVDDDFLERLGAELQPGRAAVVLLVRGGNPDDVVARIGGGRALIRTSLSAADEEALGPRGATERDAAQSGA